MGHCSRLIVIGLAMPVAVEQRYRSVWRDVATGRICDTWEGQWSF